LSCAIALQGEAGVYALAADTDGIDGTEEHAGACIMPYLHSNNAENDINMLEYLDNNDAYNFFRQTGGLVVTGPTYTNVNDFRAVLVL
jgi:hydroxypyruvate reductase